MKKEKNYIKIIFAFTLGVILSAGIVYGYSMLASSVGFTPPTGMSSTNVQSAIDELYSKVDGSYICRRRGTYTYHQQLQVGDAFVCSIDLQPNVVPTSGTFYYITTKNGMMIFVGKAEEVVQGVEVYKSTGGHNCIMPNNVFTVAGLKASLLTRDLAEIIGNSSNASSLYQNIKYLGNGLAVQTEDYYSNYLNDKYPCYRGGLSVGECECSTQTDVTPVIYVKTINVKW